MQNKCCPLVSAVITTHNRLNLLKHAIDSVVSQTYKNIEIIVVDDASTDETQAYLASLDNITSIRVDKSLGGNHARNIGICSAKGKYVAFLDDDDEWFPTKIEKQVRLICECSKCGVVGCSRVFYDGNHRWRERIHLPEGNLSESILYEIPYVTSTLLVDREILLEVGMFDEHIARWQEYELQMRLYQVTEVCCVKENLVLYRVNYPGSNSLSADLDNWKSAVDAINIKHGALIQAASPVVQSKRAQLVLIEGARRAKAIGNKKACRAYLRKLLHIDISLKNLIKYIICKPSIH